ncbi:MAG: hypothetical protein ABSH33_06065 [Steroidobacteraceae bacterium]|jgi:hypothetical protein
MRGIFCLLLLLLPACASHNVRCDGRLQPINLPGAGAGARAGTGTGSGAALGLSTPAHRDAVPPRSAP